MAVYNNNLKHDLSDHANPQRPSYAFGDEGGLLLCSWPKGGKLSLPFVYSDKVWTGIEYQVASHLMLVGRVEEGLDIVRTCRDRYDGRRRNPFHLLLFCTAADDDEVAFLYCIQLLDGFFLMENDLIPADQVDDHLGIGWQTKQIIIGEKDNIQLVMVSDLLMKLWIEVDYRRPHA